LQAALGCGVALAKPSRREFEALVGHSLPDRAALEAAALAMVRAGALEMLVVSLGGEGAFLATEAGGFLLPAPDVTVLSAVGAGDSLLAAMVLSLARGETAEIAFAWGMAAGAAAVASAGTAHPDPLRVEEFFRRLRGGASSQA
jgi:6-phosphofructokinase 2